MAISDERSTKKDDRDRICVLADVSWSMEEIDRGTGSERKSRFDLLKKALADLPKDVRILAFNESVREVASLSEIRLGGGTSLHVAIEAAARLSPVRTIIVSDGEPDSESLAHKALESLTGLVDVVYCGSPDNVKARKFLESLAREGQGGYYETGDTLDVDKQLPAVIKGLLGS
jgi:hypothetical protein